MTASALLPKELWDVIFVHACTDDGTTGRALSLVSRHIRTVSADHKHRSVALYGNMQVAAFAALLRDEGCRPELRQLHNSLVEVDPFTKSEKIAFERPPASRPTTHDLLRGCVYEYEDETEELTVAELRDSVASMDLIISSVRHILRLAAPTLVHLTLIAKRLEGKRFSSTQIRSRAKVGLRSLLSITLPLLTEMTVMGINCTSELNSMAIDSSNGEGSDGDDASGEGGTSIHRARFASVGNVRRLHTDSPRSTIMLARSLPHLSHLRVSDPLAIFEDPDWMDAFFVALRTLQNIHAGELAGMPASRIADVRILERLKIIIIQTTPGLLPPALMKDGHLLGSPANYRRRMYRSTENMLSECQDRIPSLVILKNSSTSFSLRDALVNQWLDRNTGGEGCWNSMEE